MRNKQNQPNKKPHTLINRFMVRNHLYLASLLCENRQKLFHLYTSRRKGNSSKQRKDQGWGGSLRRKKKPQNQTKPYKSNCGSGSTWTFWAECISLEKIIMSTELHQFRTSVFIIYTILKISSICEVCKHLNSLQV